MQKTSILSIFGCSLLIVLSIKTSFAQVTTEDALQELVNYTNSEYGSDDRLVTGRIYYPTHPLALGHPYFLKEDWLNAILYIKGNEFDNVEIKYNIEDDRIILKRKYEKGLIEPLLLINSYIDSLIILDRLFLNSLLIEPDKKSGFIELVYRGKLTSFLKHINSYKDELSPHVMHGKYRDPKTVVYIHNGKALRHIKRKKEFLEFFPGNEKKVTKFMKTKNINIKKANKDQLLKLMKYCDTI